MALLRTTPSLRILTRMASKNSTGYIASNGRDCQAITALITSSVHDSQVAVPLSLLSAQRVTSLYDVMDAAYCSEELRQHSRNLGHVPLIDHNPRNGTKRAFDTCEAKRPWMLCNGGTQATRICL